jgi:hypothetical protein
MKILRNNAETKERYSEIYRRSNDASVYQSPEWLDVLEALKGELIFLQVNDDAIIPFICKGRGRLRRCYSLSYDTYGGPVSCGNTTVAFDEVVRALGVPSVRMVDFSSNLVERLNSVIKIDAHIVDLKGGEEIVQRAYTKKNREALRQSTRRGIHIEKMEDPALLDAFYALHVHTARKHRTLPHPRSIIEMIYKNMKPKNMAAFYFAVHEDRAVACNLILRDKKTAYDWLLGYKKDSLKLRPTNALIDRSIRDEIKAGSESFNLGASPSQLQGIVKFKESFGAKRFPYRIFFKAGFSFHLMRNLKSRVVSLAQKDILGNSNGIE